ncbi:hypothetical protein Tco_1228654 [Tanacetum coccineum]
MIGESSSGQDNKSEPSPSTLGNQEELDDFDFWTDFYATDDDELPTEKVSQEIVDEMSQTVDEAKLHKVFITEIIARRKNGSIVSITYSDYKNLNKNDIEDMYLLIVNDKLGVKSYQRKVNLTAPIINFPGIKKYKVFSIVSELVYGIMYKNSKKEKRVMRLQEIHKFCDATLKRVLEGLNSYNNDVKHGYVTPSLSKEDVEYLQLFEEEIEEWLKHHDQMRRLEILFNNHTRRNNEEAIHEERKPNDNHGIRNFDNDLVWNNAPCHANEEEDQYGEDRCELLENPCQELPVCKIGSFEVIKYSFGPAQKYIAIKECEHGNWKRTKEDACHAYQGIFRIMDEGWFVTRAE